MDAMRTRLLAVAFLCLHVVRMESLAQDQAARTDRYSVCIAKVRNAPEDAYDPCRQYLEQSSSDDAKRIQWVKN